MTVSTTSDRSHCKTTEYMYINRLYVACSRCSRQQRGASPTSWRVNETLLRRCVSRDTLCTTYAAYPRPGCSEGTCHRRPRDQTLVCIRIQPAETQKGTLRKRLYGSSLGNINSIPQHSRLNGYRSAMDVRMSNINRHKSTIGGLTQISANTKLRQLLTVTFQSYQPLPSVQQHKWKKYGTRIHIFDRSAHARPIWLEHISARRRPAQARHDQSNIKN